MAKRRRAGDRKKRHKHDRKRRSGARDRSKRDKESDLLDEDFNSSDKSDRTMDRAQARTKRNDMMVVAVAIIFIMAVIGSYFAYTNYLQPDESEENEIEIKPNPNGGPTGGLYDVPEFDVMDQQNPVVVIEVKDYGPIVVELYEKQTPLTVNNFLVYTSQGFFNNLIFHRVIDGFMIQGGGFDTELNQKSASNPPIQLEIDPLLKHVDGAIAMARTSNPDSATSQFFINDGPQPQLEPGGSDPYGYAVFGQVVSGMEHVRAISNVPTQTEGSFSDVPVNDVIINSVYIYQGE
jgi:cyclophilin family peptidyl-prolyl cis-trans isomerase